MNFEEFEKLSIEDQNKELIALIKQLDEEDVQYLINFIKENFNKK